MATAPASPTVSHGSATHHEAQHTALPLPAGKSVVTVDSLMRRKSKSFPGILGMDNVNESSSLVSSKSKLAGTRVMVNSSVDVLTHRPTISSAIGVLNLAQWQWTHGQHPRHGIAQHTTADAYCTSWDTRSGCVTLTGWLVSVENVMMMRSPSLMPGARGPGSSDSATTTRLGYGQHVSSPHVLRRPSTQ